MTQAQYGYISDSEIRRVALRSGVVRRRSFCGVEHRWDRVPDWGPFGVGIEVGVGYCVASLGLFTADRLQTNIPKIGMFAIMTDAERDQYINDLLLYY